VAQAIQYDSHRSETRRRPVPIQLSLFFIIKKERKQIRGGQWLAGGYLRPSVLGLISVFPMDTAQIKKPVLFLSSSRFPFVQYLRRHRDAGYSSTTKHEGAAKFPPRRLWAGVSSVSRLTMRQGRPRDSCYGVSYLINPRWLALLKKKKGWGTFPGERPGVTSR